MPEVVPLEPAEDFERLGMDAWARADTLRTGNDERRRRLRELIDWRNAIAHDDIAARLARSALRPDTVTLATCRTWRSALNVLAGSLDRAAAEQCAALGRHQAARSAASRQPPSAKPYPIHVHASAARAIIRARRPKRAVAVTVSRPVAVAVTRSWRRPRAR